MNEAHAALLRERDGEMRFRHSVHRGADDGDVQRNFAGQTGSGVRLGGQNFAPGRYEEHIVEGEPFGDRVQESCVVYSV